MLRDICNFKRGIPACENFAFPLVSGFDGMPCVDPYLCEVIYLVTPVAFTYFLL